MRSTISVADSSLEPVLAGPGAKLRRQLLWIVTARAVILFFGLNSADSLGLLPSRLGPFPFLLFFNLVFLLLTGLYLCLWWTRWSAMRQLRMQAAVDLCATTLIVAHTGGVESVFTSLYVLIIIYCGLTLGRNAGMICAALSTILYAGIITAGHAGLIPPSSLGSLKLLVFRVSINCFGFFSVAFLGTTLSHQLRAVQQQLQEKILSLQRLQSLNEHIVSSIRSGLITTDLDGRVAVFNNTAGELTARKPIEILNSPVREVIGDGFWKTITSADLLGDPRPLRHEDWFVLPNGNRRFLGFSVSPLMDKKRQLLGYIISFQDLTEIKRLEEEVRIKDRMAAIGRMAAGIAHEIRNPLTSMRGSVELLREHAEMSLPHARLLDILIRESDRLNKFVEDFLQFARPGKYSKESLDLASLLAECTTLLRNSPEVTKKHQVTLALLSRPIRIWGNADQLRQVFWNLARNALRAMPDAGTLKITAQEDHDRSWQVAFEDSGVGMSHEETEHLFQPLHSGFSGSTGLGLSIVFQIMEDHHGRISIESEKGHGTTVTLTFPADGIRP